MLSRSRPGRLTPPSQAAATRLRRLLPELTSPSASFPLARDAITGAATLGIVIVTFLVLSFTRVDTAWVMLGAAAVGLASKLLQF